MKQGRRMPKFILHHWWTHVIWKMLNWRQSTKNSKVELYSEVILQKMILDLLLHSLNKAHRLHKWQLQRSWISLQDCLVAMDKQQMQYQLIPKWKWKIVTNYRKFPKRNVQTFGFVYHDTNGLNHGLFWSVFVDDIKFGWKETESWSDVENS